MSSAKEPVTRRFGNGLTVLITDTSLSRSVPPVPGRHGVMNEGHWQGGLSHLLEHLVFKGTAHFSGRNWPVRCRNAAATGMRTPA
ncbi:MAG: insulinase family protein [Akkermansia sp.]